MKRLILAGALASVGFALAMPTKKDLVKAQSVVNELMGPVVADFRDKKKEAAEVALSAESLADEASTEAAKFLLLKGAIAYYVRGDEYDKAADVVERLQNEVKDIPPEVLAEIISRASSRISAKNAPRLFAQYRTASTLVSAEKELIRCTAALNNNPNDIDSRRKLAESLAVLGKWEKALDEFTKVRGEAARIARGEKSGSVKANEAAGFWWGYVYGEEDEITPFKRHAAELYRKALKEGLLSGLNKTLAERRIAETERVIMPVAEEENKEFAVQKGVSGKKSVASASNDGRKAAIAFKIDNVQFNMLACKPGTFRFSLDFKKPERKITITRNYWMGATPVTYEQWWSVMTPDKSKRKPIYKGGEKAPVTMVSREDIEKFCKELTRRNKRYLPSCYEFRLPTVAEWEWAGRAGREIPKIDYTKPYDPKTQDPYDVAFYFGPHQEGTYDNALKPIGLAMAPTFKLPTIYEIFPLNGYHRHTDWCTSMLTPFPVAKFKANKWGFYDMIGNAAELMADMLPHVKTSYPSKRVLWIGDLGQFHAIKGYQSALDQELKDPYFACRDNLPPQRCSYFILRGMPNGEDFFKYPDGIKFPEGARKNCGATWIWFRRSHEPLGPICSFRLCIGPKLKPTSVN